MALNLVADVSNTVNPFRMFRRRLLDTDAHVDDPNISIDVLLTWATMRRTSVTVDFRERRKGESGYNYRPTEIKQRSVQAR